MNPFESTLTAALHEEAREIAMSTDLHESFEVIEGRFDDIDRGRRIWRVVGTLAAAAVVIAVIAFSSFGQPTASQPPAATVPSASASVPSVPALSTEITGAWSTSMSPSDVERTLARAGLGAYRDRVFQLLGLTADPGPGGFQFQAYIAQGYFRLYTVAADGTETKIDEHVFDLDGDVMTGTAARGALPPEVLVMKVALDSPRMRFTWIADSGPAAEKGVPNEALERVLYTTSTWVRSTI